MNSFPFWMGWGWVHFHQFTDRCLRPPPPCPPHQESSGDQWKTAPTCGQTKQMQIIKGTVHSKIKKTWSIIEYFAHRSSASLKYFLWTSNLKMVRSQSVEALSLPPCLFRKASKPFSAGYFSLPIKTTGTERKNVHVNKKKNKVRMTWLSGNALCSRKWARPGRSAGSLKLPTLIQSAAADWDMIEDILDYISTKMK